MSDGWVMVVIAALGMAGQLWISARRSGADSQRAKSLGEDVLGLKETTLDHETRISHLEGRLAPRHGDAR